MLRPAQHVAADGWSTIAATACRPTSPVAHCTTRSGRRPTVESLTASAPRPASRSYPGRPPPAARDGRGDRGPGPAGRSSPWLRTAASSATSERQVHVLLDEHDRAAVVGGDPADRLEELLDDQRGQAHAQLVDEQDLRLLDERPGHREHLLLATRQATPAGEAASAPRGPGTRRARRGASGRPCGRRPSGSPRPMRDVNRQRLSGTSTTPAWLALVGRPLGSGGAVDRDRARPSRGAARRCVSSSVVLPAPFGPSRARTSPASTVEVDVAERRAPSPGCR